VAKRGSKAFMWVGVWKGCVVAHVPKQVATPYLGHVPQNFQDKRMERDNTKDLHVTIVGPGEMGDTKVSSQVDGVLKEHLQHEKKSGHHTIDLEDLVVFGLGKQQKADNEVFYLLGYCQKFNFLRKRLGLPTQAYYHMTIGFRFADLHGISKDMNTLVVRAAPLKLERLHTINNLAVLEGVEREFGYTDPKACALRFKVNGKLSPEDRHRLLKDDIYLGYLAQYREMQGLDLLERAIVSFTSRHRDMYDPSNFFMNFLVNEYNTHQMRAASKRRTLVFEQDTGLVKHEMPRNFSWVEENKIGGISKIRSKADVLGLKALGVKRVYYFLEKHYFDDIFDGIIGIEVHYIYCENERAPTLQDMKNCLDNEPMDSPVFFGCLGGFGRTGTALACYLCKKTGKPGQECIFDLRNIRPKSIENDCQMSFVREFSGYLHKELATSNYLSSSTSDSDVEKRCSKYPLVILVGLPGSGKSTFSELLASSDIPIEVISQDNMGRTTCEHSFLPAIKRAKREKSMVILDRTNSTIADRKEWLQLSTLLPKDCLCVHFITPKFVCIERAKGRVNHPTIKKGGGERIINDMDKKLEPPTKEEGFKEVVRLEDEEDVKSYLKTWGCKVVTKEEPFVNKLKIHKFPRTRHLVNLGAASRDDLMVNNKTEYFADGQEIQICEKVDGAQMGLSVDENYKIKAQNRSHYVTSQSASQFKPLDKWIYQHQEALYQILDPDHILFGEWLYAKHSIAYNKLPDYFMAYDLFNKVEGKFYNRDILEEKVKGTNIVLVREIFRGKIKKEQDILAMLKMESAYATEGKLEGVYVKIFEGDYVKERSKIVRTDFLSGNEHWTRGNLEPNTVVHYVPSPETNSSSVSEDNANEILISSSSIASTALRHAFVLEAKNTERKKHSSKENENLNMQLHGIGQCVNIVGDDGNCLFRSIADQLDGNESKHLKHRRRIIKFMEEHSSDFEPFIEGFHEYCQRMKRDGEWGGHQELVAASRLWNAIVEVHRLGQCPLRIEGDADGRVLCVSYHGAKYYNSVKKWAKETKTLAAKFPAVPPSNVAELKEELKKLEGTQNAKKRKQLKAKIAELELETVAIDPNTVTPLIQVHFDENVICQSDEIAQEQGDELDALSAIYDEAYEIRGQSPGKKGDACGCFAISLRSCGADAKLAVQFQSAYPAHKRSINFKLEHAGKTERNCVTKVQEALLLSTIKSQLDQLDEGEQCGFLVIGVAEEWARNNFGEV